MSRTKRFLGGISFGYANQLLVMAAGLWLTPFLLYRIGQHDYGLWLVGAQILSYLTLMDFGVVALLPRATAYATGRAGSLEKASDLPEIIGQTLRLVLWQMPFVALAALILWLVMPTEWATLRMPLGLVMLAFVITFPLRIFAAVLQGLQDLAFLGKVVIFTWFISTATTICLILAGLGLYSLAVGWILNQTISSLICYGRLRRRFPRVLPRKLSALTQTSAKAQLTKGTWASVAQIAQVLLNGTDVLIIGKLLGPLAVVPFVCTGKLTGVLANQPQMLMQAAAPALSEMRMGESRERLFNVCTALSQAMLMISGAVVCVVLTINRSFVSWWVGAEQFGGFLLSGLILLEMLLRHWNTTAAYTIFCFGYERRLAITTLIDGVLSVCAAIVLVWLIGPIGAPLGTILGVSLVSLPGNLSVMTRESGVTIGTLVKSLWPWLWRFVLLLTVAWGVTRVFVPQGLMITLATAALSALVYAVVMLPVALRAPLGEYLQPYVTSIRGKLFGTVRSIDPA
jgi:O-antigen/teichoic acid export membrane protein